MVQPCKIFYLQYGLNMVAQKGWPCIINVHENRAEIPAYTVPVVLPVTQLRLIK